VEIHTPMLPTQKLATQDPYVFPEDDLGISPHIRGIANRSGFLIVQTHLGQPELQHEMSNYSQSSNYDHAGAPAMPPPSSTVLTQQDFLARVDYAKSEIRALTSNIQEIASLHQRALSSPDNNSSAQLENLVTQTQLKNTQIRDQIKYLEADAAKTQDGTKNVKVRQAKQLKSDFEKSLKEYQQEEVAYRQRYRDQIARQFRIVNPEATEAEVQEASELDWGSEGVFQTAVGTFSVDPRSHFNFGDKLSIFLPTIPCLRSSLVSNYLS